MRRYKFQAIKQEQLQVTARKIVIVNPLTAAPLPLADDRHPVVAVFVVDERARGDRTVEGHPVALVQDTVVEEPEALVELEAVAGGPVDLRHALVVALDPGGVDNRRQCAEEMVLLVP